MSRRGRRSVAVLALAASLLTPLALRAEEPKVDPAATAEPAPLLVNLREPTPGLLTGGAPVDAEGWAALAAAGVRTVVDLRTDAELTPEVEGWITEAGLVRIRIPVDSDADLDLAAARAWEEARARPSDGVTALVCRSGNRTGALLAVDAFWMRGLPAEEALELGRAAGLTRLEPSVRQLLGLPPLPPAPETPPAAN